MLCLLFYLHISNRKQQRYDEIFRHFISYFVTERWKAREMKHAEALGVVSFHGNCGVWKGLLAFAVPVVYNIHNWLGLMRRRSAITTSHRHIHQPHMPQWCRLRWCSVYLGGATRTSSSVLKLKWLIDRRVHLSGSCLLFWLLLSLIPSRSPSWVTFALIITVIIQQK